MEHHELWFTAFLNRIFGPAVTSVLQAIGITPQLPEHPISNFFAMEILVVVFLIVFLGWLRTRLSSDRPGHVQQVIELIVGGLQTQGEEIIGHGSRHFIPLLFTLVLFIFPSNVLGEIPGFETPTAFIQVTLGCALVAFCYYNFWGFRHHGAGGYLKTFLGPVFWLAPLMFLIELISHMARALSLSVRLYANMLAGENITAVFFSLIPVGVPAVFMGIHIAVGALQTFIFILLTTVYLSGAVSEGH
ncbi:MAG: F0F1 ATP synthase subunit A [Acidobacteria bacterium]|nr:F0F1 ATP synthase subunit A [Acidobacteriota bacterium]